MLYYDSRDIIAIVSREGKWLLNDFFDEYNPGA
jgi:hypothetical protein